MWVAAGLNSVHHMVCFFTDPRNKICKGAVQKMGNTKRKNEKETASLTRVTRGCTLSPLLMVLPHVLYRDGWIDREKAGVSIRRKLLPSKKKNKKGNSCLSLSRTFKLSIQNYGGFFLNEKRNREIMFLTFHICVGLNHSGGG